jgi:hypothetical protein
MWLSLCLWCQEGFCFVDDRFKTYDLIAPTSLIFYGLAQNGSKYTMGEVRWLGYGEILLGVINLWVYVPNCFSGHSDLVFFHIIYGCYVVEV